MVTRRLAVIAVSAALAVSLPGGPAAAAPSCLPQVISAEKEVYGTGWGLEAVSDLARNPGLADGASSLGEVARSIAQAPRDSCPSD